MLNVSKIWFAPLMVVRQVSPLLAIRAYCMQVRRKEQTINALRSAFIGRRLMKTFVLKAS